MDATAQLEHKKQIILEQIAALGPMRMGSISERMQPTRRPDGSVHHRGPYMMYTYKKAGKTLGRQLPAGRDAALYRRQIENYRRFEQLSRELVETSQSLADLEAAGDKGAKKNSRSGSNRRKAPKPSAS